ncbi:MAG: EVE domain-containing protein, partial [Phormidesmis sp.]
TQFDPSSKYHDPKSTPASPRWHTVIVAYERKFDHYLSLDQLKAQFTPKELLVVKLGNRLSVMPVDQEAAARILHLAEPSGPPSGSS